MTENESRAELKRQLDLATCLMNATDDPDTKAPITEMVRELERLVEMAADREHLVSP